MIWLVVVPAAVAAVILQKLMLEWDPYPGRAPSDAMADHIEKLQFRCDLAEVQILLDFLSGQPGKAFLQVAAAHSWRQRIIARVKRSGLNTALSTGLLKEDDLRRLAGIRFPPDKNREANARDAVLLMKMRDQLNQLAAPASGLSIAFTLLIWTPFLHSRNSLKNWARWHLATEAYPMLEKSARCFRAMTLAFVFGALMLTGLTLWMSNTAADGAVKLARIEGLKQNRTSLTPAQPGAENVQAAASRSIIDGQVDGAQAAMKQWWLDWQDTPLMHFRCWMIQWTSGDSTECHRDRSSGLVRFVSNRPFVVAASSDDAQSESLLIDLASDLIAGLLGTWLPVLWGAIGSLVVTARTVYGKISTSTLLPSDIWLLPTRLILGVMAGSSIGLFFAPTGAAVRANLAIGTLSLSAIAFLAGYAVDGLFKLLDEIKERLFRTGADTRPVAAERGAG